MSAKRILLSILPIGLGLGLVFGLMSLAAAASQVDISGPPGSGNFGVTVTILPNGNIVVSDPSYDAGPVADVGAVYLYDGASGALISMLTGNTAGDKVGSDGVTVLANGNYVVRSTKWVGADIESGAVTWGDGTQGVNGTVNAANSLVGSSAFDHVGASVTALANGNYVVGSPEWNNGGNPDFGAATWGNGTRGVTGTISSANSLVGSDSLDSVGTSVTALANGNYVVSSPEWTSGFGAATWGDGSKGVTGTISTANSLVGSTSGYDHVGLYVIALANGNYVVASPQWSNGDALRAGAATWGDGSKGVTGTVSAANSLVGSTAADYVGNSILELANGNYLVSSTEWDNGAIENAGAITWGDGTHGVTGEVSATNSLVGSSADDRVGYSVTELANSNYVVSSPLWNTSGNGAATWGDGAQGVTGTVSAANSLVGGPDCYQVGYGITALTNGNYVVSSPYCSLGVATGIGAVTWGDGTKGMTGTVSAANSLVGSTTFDYVGHSVDALANGNYVVSNTYWDNGAIEDAGAVTWGDGSKGVTGTVSADNSLLGSTTGDYVGSHSGITALTNGNYVVGSPEWDNGEATEAGAVTWGDGSKGVTGTVSAANSLVGSTASNWVGSSVTALANGNYVVGSYVWDNGAIDNAGAATWGEGTKGVTGTVSAANSLVGSTTEDMVGSSVTALADGNYVVSSPYWDNGAAVDAGAVSWGDGSFGTMGAITADNSVRGAAAGSGSSLNYVYDDLNQQLVVGRPGDNIVTLFRPSPEPNQAPVANAGSDQTVQSLSAVTLDGSASNDPDGNLPLAYGWTQSGGPTVTLSSTAAISPTFTAPAVVTQTSILTFTLVVTDSLGLPSLPDQVVITVKPYSVLLPVISSQDLP